MPGGRRNAVSRTGPTARSGSGNVGSANANGRSNSGERTSVSSADDKRLDEIYGGRSLAPKHIPIPAVPVDGKLSFEALSVIVSIIAACLQLLNLYRTVWWLPNSYNGYTMVRCIWFLLHIRNKIMYTLVISKRIIVLY